MTYDGRRLLFGTVAEQYDLYRPSPPPEAESIIGDILGSDVLEVGAGTGKWTRLLIELGAIVTVVEPDDDMRAVLIRRSPNVRSVNGAAEAMPLEDQSFDAVLVSSAWHWFKQPAATNEMARVLRDSGRLLILWNVFRRADSWSDAIAALRDSSNEGRHSRKWRDDFNPNSKFVIETEVQLDWTWTRSVDDLVSLFGTYSGVIIRSESEQRDIEDEVRSRLEERAEEGVVEFPMTVRGIVARRKARS